MTNAVMRAVERANPHPVLTPARLMSAPLSELFDEAGVAVVDCIAPDPDFFGLVEKRGDEIILFLPAGRDRFERDTMARYLLGQVLDAGLPALPSPFATTELAVAA